MYQLDKNSKLPLYYQLMQLVIDKIDNNMETDEKLPSERDFCNRYNLSRSTVRQAFFELEKEGYIYKVHGKGTFVSLIQNHLRYQQPYIYKVHGKETIVSNRNLQQELLGFCSSSTEIKKTEKEPSSKIITFSSMACDKNLAQKMKQEEGSMVYCFLKLCWADDIPVMLETSYVPQNRFEGLTKKSLEQNPIYDLFKHIYKVNFTHVEERFQAVLTDEVTAKYLKVKNAIPSLKIEGFTYELEQIIEYTVSIARGDQVTYSVKLNK